MEQPERKRKVEEEEGDISQVTQQQARPDEKKAKQEVSSIVATKDAAPPTTGARIRLVANCFPVYWAPERIYVHHMHFDPQLGQETSIHVKRTFLAANKAALATRYFPYGELLFAQRDLSGQTFKGTVNGIDYTMTLSEKVQLAPNKAVPERLAMFSRLFKMVLGKKGFLRIRDSVYDSHNAIQVRDMKGFRGFSTNVANFQAGILLNLDLAYKWIQSRTVLQMLRRDRLHDAQLMEKQTVLTQYGDRQRFYRVHSIDFDKTPRSTFMLRRRGSHKYATPVEEEISFADYYRRVHNQHIHDLNQPLLKVVEKRRRPTDGALVEEVIYLVPELCVLANLTEDMRTDGQLRLEMMHKTSADPGIRMRELEKLIAGFQFGGPTGGNHYQPHPGGTPAAEDPASVLAEWGVVIDPKPLGIEGRVLPKETLKLGQNAQKDVKAIWRDLFGEPPGKGRPARPSAPSVGMFDSIALESWVVFGPPAVVNDMVAVFNTVKHELGLVIEPPHVVPVASARQAPDAMRQWRGDRKPQIFVVILQTNAAATYNSVKQVMADIPIPIQCVRQQTVVGGQRESKCKGVLQQMVCKMGGAPWSINIPFPSPTMIVGIDISHAKTTFGQSVLAYTATLNSSYTRYFGDIKTQRPNQEIATSLVDSFKRSLDRFYDYNQCLPDRIIIYRDDPGGRGSRDAMMMHEVVPLLEFMREKNVQASLTVLVVSKRGLMRVVTPERQNPPAGTVIDTGIVSRDYNDFFLIPHTCRVGTVKPTQYQVVYRTPGSESQGTSTDILQQLTYKLCHLYYNFMGTIAEPAPLRYADRLAGLVRQAMTMGTLPHADLSDLLFYL